MSEENTMEGTAGSRPNAQVAIKIKSPNVQILCVYCSNCGGMFWSTQNEKRCEFCCGNRQRTQVTDRMWQTPGHKRAVRDVTLVTGTPCKNCKSLLKSVEKGRQLCFDCKYPCIVCGSLNIHGGLIALQKCNKCLTPKDYDTYFSMRSSDCVYPCPGCPKSN